MTLAYYRQRLRNVCTDHCFAKKVCQKISGRIFQVRFATGRVFKVHFSLRASFHRTEDGGGCLSRNLLLSLPSCAKLHVQCLSAEKLEECFPFKIKKIHTVFF